MKINFQNTKLHKTIYDNINSKDCRLPEIAFVGRSNVGKSSLINLITGNNNLAKVSQTPGKTRSINFFNVDDKFYLVDLPGFGYSKLSKETDLSLKRLIESYFFNNKNLLSVCHLVDSRHIGTKLDILMNSIINDFNYNYFIVLTKIDKLKFSEQNKAKISVFDKMKIKENTKVILSSVKSGKGKEEIHQFLMKLLD